MKSIIGFILAFICAYLGMSISDSFVSDMFSGIIYCILRQVYNLIAEEKESQ